MSTSRALVMQIHSNVCASTAATHIMQCVDRRDLLEMFRERLGEVILSSGQTRSAFAADAAIDRSTLSQLLSDSNRRLPRVETLVELASAHQVSIDWLLGLSHGGRMEAEMLPERTSFERNARSYDDERLISWFDEARGHKVRYVPSTLPDLLKTDDLIRFELGAHVSSRPEQKIDTAAARLAWISTPGSDLECCSSIQSVETLAAGEGIWRELPTAARLAQLEQMRDLTRSLYPRLRWFCFDALERYAAPVTIFGQQRAALYLGQMYLVLTSAEHVQTLTENFDDLIRGARVQPVDVPDFLDELLARARRAPGSD